MSRLLIAASVGMAFLGGAPASAMSAKAFMKAVDADADRTISKDEVEAFAKKRFEQLDSDRDKTLDAKELKKRLSMAGIKAADIDHDKSVDESEFVGFANKLFDEANRKGDQTLSAKELESPAGRKLIQLLE